MPRMVVRPIVKAGLAAQFTLDAVHGRVGLPQQFFRGCVGLGEQRNPEAGAQPDGAVPGVERLLQGRDDLVAHGSRGFRGECLVSDGYASACRSTRGGVLCRQSVRVPALARVFMLT